jgi:hypothetical protein
LFDGISLVSDTNMAEVVCASSKRDIAHGMQTHGHSFAILSASGTLHTPHFDPNGMGTLLYMQEGYKFFVFGTYKGDLCALPPFPSTDRDKGLWAIMDMEGLDLVSFVLGPGDAV